MVDRSLQRNRRTGTGVLIAAIFPEEQRGLANGLIDVGGKLGPAIGWWRGLILTDSAGGPAPFPGPSMADILKKREAWGTFLRHRDRSCAGRRPLRRLECVTGGCGSAVLLLPPAIAGNQVAAKALLIFSSFVFGLSTANVFAVTQTLAGVTLRW